MYLDPYVSNRYFTEGTKVAVALSGGADSVFLLHVMCDAAKEKAFTLCAIHVNHMIRGEEADRDENFCRSLCERLGIAFFSQGRNVPAEAEKSGCSLEETARNVRYSVFEEIMRRENIGLIATAHNADDVAENMLIRMMRGTSLDGMCGIPRERELAFGKAVRPILGVTKEEILAYCKERSISFVTDSTNLCDDYTRNKIRHHIIPVMREMNPAFLSVCGRNAEAFSIDSEYLRAESDRLYLENLSGGMLHLCDIKNTHKALLSRVINKYCISMGARPEKEHIDLLADAISKGTDMSLSLPGQKRAVLEKGCLSVLFDRREKTKTPEYSFPLFVGENHFTLPECGGCVTAVLRKLEESSELIFHEEKYSLKQSLIYNLSTHKVLNFDTIKDELFLRNRRAGDTIDLGLFRKTLKKLMNEKEIPKNLRDILPCLCEGDEVIYVPFAAEAFRCNRNSSGNRKKLYLLKLELEIDLTEE